MSSWLMGLPARIQALSDLITGPVQAGIDATPWRVTALPTIPDTSMPLATVTTTSAIICAGASTQTLASDTTLQTLVDVTGSGYIDFLALQAAGAVAGTMRAVVTIDGTVIADKTSVSSATANRTIVILGEYATSVEIMSGGHPIHFRSSLKIEAQQSATITLKVISRYRLAEPYAA